MTCKKCGGEIMEGNAFCVHCGAQIEQNTVPTTEAQPVNEPVGQTTEGPQPAQYVYGGNAPEAQSQSAQYSYGNGSPEPAPAQPAQYVYGGNMPGNTPSMQPQMPMDGKPINQTLYLVLAIVALLCCCLPSGIVSLVYAIKIDNFQSAGDYDGAQEAAKKTKMWLIISLIAGILSSIITFVLFTFAGASGLGNYPYYY